MSYKGKWYYPGENKSMLINDTHLLFPKITFSCILTNKEVAVRIDLFSSYYIAEIALRKFARIF